MKIWLITVGEPLPTDSGTPRLLRTGILAAQLAERGHDVVWWSSNFDHSGKRVRPPLQPGSARVLGYELRLLDGCSYSSNVSLARIVNHRQVAQNFAKLAMQAVAPDVILCSFPTIELCNAAVDYGKAHAVPVALDVRDLWPDIFVNLLPAPLRPIGKIPLFPMHRASQQCFAGATAVFGITDAFVNWGIRRGGRVRGPSDAAFPLAYDLRPVADSDLHKARQTWSELGVAEDGNTFCFFGTLGRQFDIPTLLAAARLLRSDIKLVICGAGDRLASYRAAACDLPNVLFPGWVGSAAIRTLMERSLAGLAPYYNEWSFTLSLPNKPIEYLAGGLPVLSSLSGELEKLLNENACGLTYPEGDAQALASMMMGMVSNRAQRADMASNAARCFREQFDAAVVYDKMIDQLQLIANQRTNQPEDKNWATAC